jgi:HAD superfamily hydrolase (TIGR01450 family)
LTAKDFRALASKKLFLFDLDGVLYKGKEKPVKLGGSKAIEAIRSLGRQLFVLTNNSTDTVETLHRNLVGLGIHVREQEILTSSRLTSEYIADKYGRASYFLVGEEGFDRELIKLGHRRVRGQRADVVAIGLDRHITYEKLDAAAKVARNGAALVASHAAKIYMSGSGPAMGPGPIVKALEYASGKKATAIGKPSPLMFRIALRKAGCTAEEAVMLGDQLDTDVQGAASVGIDPILVLTGVDRSLEGTAAIGTLRNVDELARYL